MTDTTTPEVPDQECRRNTLALLGAYGFDEIDATIRSADPDADVVGFVLQVIALELVATSLRLDEETTPALQAVGAMVAGLFGQNMADDANALLHDLNAAGQRERERFTRST